MMSLEQIKRMNGSDEVKSKEPYGCGVSWLWWTGEGDPFLDACIEHDKYYDRRIGVAAVDRLIVKEADKRFKADLDKIVADKPELKVRAELYYWIVTKYRKIQYGI